MKKKTGKTLFIMDMEAGQEYASKQAEKIKIDHERCLDLRILGLKFLKYMKAQGKKIEDYEYLPDDAYDLQIVSLSNMKNQTKTK